MGRAGAASIVGALLEWYDFYVFATASALVFGHLFFPTGDPAASTMAAFGAFASGFLARPLGGLLFGHLGDRIGRKTSLVVTLAIIGTGTFLIGLLPTYAQIGATAPVLLVVLRVAQGIGLGGEYGGASLLAIEHAPPSRRGLWGSLPQTASPGGLLLATAVFGLASLLPRDTFLAWGWRVPFLASGVLLLVGLIVRMRVAETPQFVAAQAGDRAPIVELLHTHQRATALATGARLAETVAGNLVKSFGLTYVTLHLGLSRDVALDALVATSAVGLIVTPLYGALADRLGAQALYRVGAALTGALAFPLFWVLQARTAAAAWIGFIVFYNLGPTLMLSVQPTFFAELFAVRVRYTGLSFAYQVSAVVGGFTPLAALSLLRWQGGAPWAVAATLVLVALLSLACTHAARPA